MRLPILRVFAAIQTTGVVVQNRALINANRLGQVCEAAQIPAVNVLVGNIMATLQNSFVHAKKAARRLRSGVSGFPVMSRLSGSHPSLEILAAPGAELVAADSAGR